VKSKVVLDTKRSNKEAQITIREGNPLDSF